MKITVQAAAHMLADLEHELDCHLWRLKSNPEFFGEIETRRDNLRDRIPDDVLFTPEFFAAYNDRRAERDAQAERGRPFTVIEGSASCTR